MLLVAQASNAEEAMAEYARYRPDVTLMDLRLPGRSGTDALIEIRKQYPQARIIMLTTSDTDGEIQRAMRAGAAAYVFKNMPKNELLGVIRSVHAGRRHVPQDVAARIAEHLGEEELTSRELQVLRLLCDGHQIGDEAIRNAWAHSKGSQLQVELNYANDLILRVVDNGIGIESAVVREGREGHFGLQGMRERVARIAGTFTIISAPRAGSEITVIGPGKVAFRKRRNRLWHSLKSIIQGDGSTLD
jgi:CheY-like chemotaxis protein